MSDVLSKKRKSGHRYIEGKVHHVKTQGKAAV